VSMRHRGKLIRHPERHCTRCGHLLNAVAVRPGVRAPVVGDYTACCRCACIHKIGPGFELVPATLDEVEALLYGPDGDEWAVGLLAILMNESVAMHPEMYN
jgi:hypothetical protein